MKVKDGAVIAASCLETETLKTAQEGGGVLPTGVQSGVPATPEASVLLRNCQEATGTGSHNC